MKEFFLLQPSAMRWGILALLALARPALAQDVVNAGTTLSVSSGGTLYVPGTLTNAAGATLITSGTLRVDGILTNAGTATLGSGTVEVRGNLTSTGTLTGGTSTVQLTGTAAQALQVASGTTLHNVTVNNTSGAIPAVSVPNSLSVDGALTLTTGLVRTAATATLSLPDGATVSGETTGRYVQGNLEVTRAAVASAVDFGNGVVLNGTGQSLGAVSVTRTAGLQTAGVSFGTNLGTTTKGIDRVWTVTPTQQPAAAVPLTLTWLADDDNGQSSFTQAQAWQSASAAGPWVAAGAPTNAASRSLAVSAASLSTFTVSNAANPLPVELLTFTAERRGSAAQLQWQTASEKSCDRFEVEASADGRSFRRLGAVAGHGTSTQRQQYAFTDPDLARYAAELVYYRLRQVDTDGTAIYSPVRAVQVPAGAGFVMQAWPNPYGNGGVELLVRTGEAGPAQLTLHDAVGRILLSQQTAALPVGGSTIAWPAAATLPQGVYLLTVQQKGHREVVKVVRE